MKSTRLQAAALLARMLQDKDTLASLPVARTTDEAADTAFIREVCLGVCRQYPQLNALLGELVSRPLKPKDSDVTALMLIGLYQIYFMRVPHHAALNETVSSVRKPWAKGLVNAVLRNALRRFPEFPEGFSEALHFRHAHPQWLSDRIQNDWLDKTEAILEANNQRAPLTLRINLQKTTCEAYLNALHDAGISAAKGSLAESAVVLEKSCRVSDLPGYAEGLFSVQDEASQLVPLFLDAQPGMKVLDACAAPGGKTLAVLEREPTLKVTALDNDARRLERMKENLARMGAEGQVSLLCADASNPKALQTQASFDRILLDAPCSASGVIRRHPDIKVLLNPERINDLAHKQARLLEVLWEKLTVGGSLLYTTCSVLKQENSDQIEAFLQRHSDARLTTLDSIPAEPGPVGQQLLPGSHGQDGFYFALLQKCD